MSDAGTSWTSCRVESDRMPADVKKHQFFKTPKTNKLLDFDTVVIDSPVSELVKDLGELSTSV